MTALKEELFDQATRWVCGRGGQGGEDWSGLCLCVYATGWDVSQSDPGRRPHYIWAPELTV